MSSQVPQVGSRLVVVPRLADGSSGDQIPGRVLASREDLVRISWDVDHDGVYQRGDEFTIIGRDLRRRAIFLSGEGGTANLVLRGEASESRGNRRFARVRSVLKFRWRRLAAEEVAPLEIKVRDASGSARGATRSIEAAIAPKTQLGDYMERRLDVIEDLLRKLLAQNNQSVEGTDGYEEGLCDLSGSGLVIPMAGTEYQFAVAFSAINPAQQEAIVRYNFQLERARRRDGDRPQEDRTVSHVSGQFPAVGSQTCPVAKDDHLAIDFVLPMEVPVEVSVVARVVRISEGAQ
ncbi:MAG: hypothetical protein VX405_04185 [Myxococcota bacterium]|nr:hypothetical protein [Myxococcota bacterium]